LRVFYSTGSNNIETPPLLLEHFPTFLPKGIGQ
jgi:hypothetical protein